MLPPRSVPNNRPLIKNLGKTLRPSFHGIIEVVAERYSLDYKMHCMYR